MKTRKKKAIGTKDEDEGEKDGKKVHCVWASPYLGGSTRNVTPRVF
jgi:hypothetical protein